MKDQTKKLKNNKNNKNMQVITYKSPSGEIKTKVRDKKNDMIQIKDLNRILDKSGIIDIFKNSYMDEHNLL